MTDQPIAPPSNVRAVLFAYSGLLAGGEEGLGDAATRIVAEEAEFGIADGQPVGQEEAGRLLPLVGYAIDQHADHILDTDCKLTPAATIVCDTLKSVTGEMPSNELVQRVVDTFGRLEAAPIQPKCADIVRALHSRGLPTGVIANCVMPGEFMRERWSQVGLGDQWDTAVLASEWGWCMPHPTIYAQALEGLGHKPEHVLFVGHDFRTEIQGAESVGLRTVWLRSDLDKPVQQVEKSYVVRDMRILLDWLAEATP